MRQLPAEDFAPSQRKPKNTHSKSAPNSAGGGQSRDRQKVLHLQVALKKLSRRLDNYALHDLSDSEILGLLQDTRTQVLSLRLARQQLKNDRRKNNRRRS